MKFELGSEALVAFVCVHIAGFALPSSLFPEQYIRSA
jgi:hypothetical protein